MGTVTRPAKLLVALAAAVLVGGIVALWVWEGSALPDDDDTLATRILESVASDAGAVEPSIERALSLWKGAAPHHAQRVGVLLGIIQAPTAWTA